MKSLESPARIITIDGLSANGTSTITKFVAQELDMTPLSAGPFFRGFGIHVCNELGWNNFNSAPKEEQVTPLLESFRFRIHKTLTGVEYFLNDHNITEEIFDNARVLPAVIMADYPSIQKNITKQIIDTGKEGGIVAEGRSMAVDRFPHATLKVLLETSPEIRLERRYAQHLKKEQKKHVQDRRLPSKDHLRAQLQSRDAKEAPRLPSHEQVDVVLNTDTAPIHSTVTAICSAFRKKINGAFWAD